MAKWTAGTRARWGLVGRVSRLAGALARVPIGGGEWRGVIRACPAYGARHSSLVWLPEPRIPWPALRGPARVPVPAEGGG